MFGGYGNIVKSEGTGICSQANLIIFICSANVFPEPIGPRIICTGVSISL
jgi:hypothetical protein